MGLLGSTLFSKGLSVFRGLSFAFFGLLNLFLFKWAGLCVGCTRSGEDGLGYG